MQITADMVNFPAKAVELGNHQTRSRLIRQSDRFTELDNESFKQLIALNKTAILE